MPNNKLNPSENGGGRRVSVTFCDVVQEQPPRPTLLSIPSIEDGDNQPSLGSPKSPDRKLRPVTRIPTEINLKTITHKVKRPAVDIEFYELSYTVKTTAGPKTLLKGISGVFEAGKLSAIMGPSGAGKTTLMNILIGYVNTGVGGSILTNGYPRNLRLFNKLSSYIMQEDLLQPNLTVFESALVAAHLKLGSELGFKDKVSAVNEILKSMGLDICQNVVVEKLSGGQRKRTSIALELVNNPPVIFLDEPTSGLDTVTTVQCINLLKDLARQGRTIVCTLHQPSSSLFHCLDRVYMVARGNCIYQGNPDQLVPFLSSVGLVCKSTYNPADYILEVLNPDIIRSLSQEIQNGKSIKRGPDEEDSGYVRKVCRKETLAVMPSVFEELQNNQGNIDKTSLEFPNSFLTQFGILFRRKMVQLSRNSMSMWIQFGHHLFSAVLMGGIYYGVGNDASRPFDNFKFCICILVFFMYTYTMSPVLLFPEEIKLLEREYFNRWYSLKAYYAVTFFSSLPNIIIFGLLFHVIVYYLSDQPMDPLRFCLVYLCCVFAASISEGIGILVGSICSRATGTIICPAVLAPVLAVAVYGMGFGEHIEPLMHILMSLSYMRYLLVATCASLYGNNRADMECDSSHVFCLYRDPKLILRDLGMADNVLLYQFSALIGFVIIFRLLAYFALRYRLNKEISNQFIVYMKKLLKGRI